MAGRSARVALRMRGALMPASWRGGSALQRGCPTSEEPAGWVGRESWSPRVADVSGPPPCPEAGSAALPALREGAEWTPHWAGAGPPPEYRPEWEDAAAGASPERRQLPSWNQMPAWQPGS